MSGRTVSVKGNDLRVTYYHGHAWLVDRTSTHPNARIFIWRVQGIPRRGRGWRCVGATR